MPRSVDRRSSQERDSYYGVSEPILTFLTDFADQAVILPVFAVIMGLLALQRRWRVAAAWALAIAGVLGTVLVLKVVCYACGWLLPAFGAGELALQSPSGHVGSGAALYGAAAALLTGAWCGRQARLIALSTAAIVAVVIGMTRLQLGAHSLSEVILAAGIGIAGAVGFAVLAGHQLEQRSGVPPLACALLVVVVMHGNHLPAEAVIQNTAGETLRRYVAACQVASQPIPTHAFNDDASGQLVRNHIAF